jgi:hypothetical protein
LQALGPEFKLQSQRRRRRRGRRRRRKKKKKEEEKKKRRKTWLGVVTYIFNPSHLGSREPEYYDSRSAQVKS